MHVRVYDKHQSTDEQEMYMSYMVLGVHSFAHFLLDLVNKKNVKILIQGKPTQVIQNILWNQYFSYTLLKDIDKTIFAQAQHRNTFLKVANKTYRLSDCLDWHNFKKMQYQIEKNHYFCLESFMTDSSIKFLTIQISAQKNSNHYDLTFEYMPHSLSLSSFSLNSTKKAQTYSIGSKVTGKNQITKTNTGMKSFQGNNPRERNTSVKYSTQKKSKGIKPKIEKTHNNLKKQKNETASCQNQQKENAYQAFSIKSVNNYTMNSTGLGVGSDLSNKQNVAAAILQRKQEKIKQYINLLEEKRREYEQKISKTEAQHEEEVTELKKEVQEVLSSYKKKNKNLRTQNECLTQMNKNLTVANKKLEEAITSLSADMQGLKQKQRILQTSNLEYRVRVESMENANNLLQDRISRQESLFKLQLEEKSKVATEYRVKYDRLLGSLKNVATEVGKENIG